MLVAYTVIARLGLVRSKLCHCMPAEPPDRTLPIQCLPSLRDDMVTSPVKHPRMGFRQHGGTAQRPRPPTAQRPLPEAVGRISPGRATLLVYCEILHLFLDPSRLTVLNGSGSHSRRSASVDGAEPHPTGTCDNGLQAGMLQQAGVSRPRNNPDPSRTGCQSSCRE